MLKNDNFLRVGEENKYIYFFIIIFIKMIGFIFF